MMALLRPPLKASGPSSPLATDCQMRIGLAPDWKCQAIMAWVVSKTPQTEPPQKIARNALAIEGHIRFRPRKSAVRILLILLQQLLRVLTRRFRQLCAAPHPGNFF